MECFDNAGSFARSREEAHFKTSRQAVSVTVCRGTIDASTPETSPGEAKRPHIASNGEAGNDALRRVRVYDVCVSLWDKDFADRQVAFESDLRGLYDYETAWRWALSFSSAERASRFAAIVRANRR